MVTPGFEAGGGFNDSTVSPELLGDSLHVLVSFAVAVILFEGGLSLDPNRLARVGAPVRNLLTIGVIVTGVGKSGIVARKIAATFSSIGLMAIYLNPLDALHGDLSQARRDQVMRNFRRKAVRILVATDVAARGLDVPALDFIVHYELPQREEEYAHRNGRTARMKRDGTVTRLDVYYAS